MDIEIVKHRVDTKSRKLKACWTFENARLIEFNNAFKIIEPTNVSSKYPYGIDCNSVTTLRLDEIHQWVEDNFDDHEYNFEGGYRELIYFDKERSRTLLILKWS